MWESSRLLYWHLISSQVITIFLFPFSLFNKHIHLNNIWARKAMPKNAQTTAQLHSSHMLVMLKSLQARLQQYLKREISDVQADFRKGRGTRDQIANILWIIEKARKLQTKKSTSASLTTQKTLTTVIFLKRWEYQTTWPASWRICMQVKKQQLELDMEQRTGSK